MPSKEALDACTIVNKDYSNEEYAHLTLTKKHKLWMLGNPGKTPGTGLTRHSRGASIASASSTGTKRMADASHEGDTSETDNPWGRDHPGNRYNKAVAIHQHAKLQKIGNDE